MRIAATIKYIILIGMITGCQQQKTNNDFSDTTFRVGQIWNYQSRAGEENSKLTVLKIEKYDSLGIVIHIYVDGLKIKNSKTPGGFSEDLGHIPISKEALQKSVTTLASENSKLPDYGEGYAIWAEAFNKNEGGIFTTELKEVINYIGETLGGAQQISN